MRFFLLISGFLSVYSSFSQTFSLINPENITIARDTFGVPHIFAPTDAEAAYGLAWAHAEDDFEHIQHNLLAAKGRLGEVLGKEGVLFDFALKFLGIDTLVEHQYEKDLTESFRKVIEGYVQGINAYAQAFPHEVLIKNALPFTGQDVIKGYVLSLSLMSGVGMALKAIKENRFEEFFAPNDQGSNALAIAPSRTEDGKTWLLINSHQPIEGRFAWYEAHINSEEGWNVIGGLFPGGVTIFVGSNEHLGWAHTTNYHNFGDVYKLYTKPGNKKYYLYDGQWKKFRNRKLLLKVKLAGLKIGLKKKVLDSEFGPVFKTKHGWFAIRFPAYQDIRSAEQWYRMNKAQNFEEFETAIKMQAIPLFNIVYADKNGNILMHSGGKIPWRNPKLNWKLPITGTSSSYKWTDLIPYEKMPSILNPACGYVYNANQTPLHATGESCNWDGKFIGLQLFEYNRGERYKELLEAHTGKFSWNDFLRIKFDKSYVKNGCYADRFKAAFELDEQKYPDIADAIQKLKTWNLSGEVDNKEAALAMVFHDVLMKKNNGPFALLMIRHKKITEEECADALRKAKRFLLKHHGSLDISLGQVQRHIRGNINIPASGLREVSRAADAKLYDMKRGLYRIVSGDGYIQLVKFGRDYPEIWSVNAYGASSKPDSPHYTDQMEMFQREEFKPMTFDKSKILNMAERIYKPYVDKK
ncbi:MAG: penicillin acylase family protein [Flavobacteriales bacterium]|nr:penicillin acylase family protein [Flavobacteriales bacterium]